MLLGIHVALNERFNLQFKETAFLGINLWIGDIVDIIGAGMHFFKKIHGTFFPARNQGRLKSITYLDMILHKGSLSEWLSQMTLPLRYRLASRL